MRLLFWSLGLTAAFGAGLAAAGWLGPGLSTTRELDRLRAVESRLQLQVSALQARLRARGVPPAESRNAAGHGTDATGDGTRPGNRSVAAATAEAYARHVRLQQEADERAAFGRAATAATPPVRAALERFYQYLEETSGAGGIERWRRMQQLADDLRGMGNAGAEALLQVLAGGGSSEERRAAAQLLGDLQAPGALPLLRDVVERDADLMLRRAAASGLRRLQTPDTVPVLEALLANPGEDRFIRMSAASGLAQLGRSQGVGALMQIFEEANADGRGRELAFRALTSLNDDRALPFMRRLLASDAEVSYRLRAIRFLGAQGDRQALGSLEQLMRSPTEQPSIRDAATRAHTAIAGR